MLRKVISLLMGIIFYRSPVFVFSEDEAMEYEHMYANAPHHNQEIIYSSTYPKFRFIQYIAKTKPVILHGSNHKHIAEFELRKQTLFDGKYVNAVFGTKDGIWPLFYAVFDKSKVVGGFRNACFKMNLTSKYYFFSLTKVTMDAMPWTDGMIYILPEKSFRSVSHTIVAFDEWISEEPVKPIAKIAVEPTDFYFINKVACHNASESIFKSWILYKRRIKQQNV